MDDTTTITAEERARLRELADKSYLLPLDEGEVPSVGFDGLTDDRIAYIAAACNSVPLLLDALEQADARAKDNSDALTAAYMSGKYDGRKEDEANVARLTKERDWLADKLIDCPSEFTNCAVGCAECRKEAARRAVAAGEGEYPCPNN